MSIALIMDLLRCPHCTQPFISGPPTLRCELGHTYDVARGGLLNLLGTAQPPNADTAAMIMAREELQATGVFDGVTAAVRAAMPSEAEVIMDAGAGPGHQLAQVVEADARRRGLAVDVSVAAGRRAAKAHPRVGAVVADVWRKLPVAGSCVDVALSIFAPRNPSEFARVLRPGGVLIIVTPRAGHLAELREPLRLLGVESDKDRRLATALTTDFDAVAEQDVISTTDWSARTAELAVAMGPNAFHLTEDDLARRLAELTWPRQVSIACRISVWCRR